MIWLVVLGLISCGLILIGCSVAMGRIRRFRVKSEERRARAFTEMMEIAERKDASAVASAFVKTSADKKAMADKEHRTPLDRAPFDQAQGRRDRQNVE